MTLFRFAIRRCRRPLILAGVLGSAGGVSSTALLTLTARGLQADEATALDVAAFVAVAIAAAAVRYVAATVTLRFSNTELAEMTYDLSHLVVHAPLRRAEELGSDRLMAALTHDPGLMTRALVELPNLVTNVVIVLGCFVYLAVSSWSILLLVLACAAAAVMPHVLIAARARERFAAARRERNELMGHYRALTDGITELKLHRPRRGAFLSEALKAGLSRIARLDIEAQSLYNLANGYRQVVFMLAAAPIVFGASFLDFDRSIATGAVLTMFYLRGPIDAVMNAFPMIARADVAVQNYERIREELPPEGVPGPDPIVRATRIDLAGVRYAYAGADGFSIGPIDLTIRAGETLFIAGANGSGKTTLAKVIAGLYEPMSGALHVDGTPVDASNRDHYRQLVTCVFPRFHLFPRLLGVDHRRVAGRAAAWLRRLDLDRTVRLEDGVFSTVDLSTGQRKRMALLMAVIDDRPICVFDEWAAEQDPQYREEFYTRVLPELRSEGRAVVVITHDDRYFRTGDRVIRMECGRIVPAGDGDAGRTRPAPAEPAAAASA